MHHGPNTEERGPLPWWTVHAFHVPINLTSHGYASSVQYNLSHLLEVIIQREFFSPCAKKMSSSILHPPANLPPSVALQLSQQAPALLSKTPSSIAPYSLSSVYAAPETPELWTTYENLMLSCLRTGDQQSARVCLDRLLTRFGGSNERLMALQGLFQEATAESDADLQRILKEYDAILKSDPANTVCWPAVLFPSEMTNAYIACFEKAHSSLEVHGKTCRGHFSPRSIS